MIFNRFISLKKISFSTVMVLGAISVVILQFNRYRQVSKEIANPNYLQQEQEALASLELRNKIPSLGFNNLIADFTYLEFIQYFGNKPARQATGYSLSSNYFQVIANRDPHFTQAYLTLSSANSIYAGKPEATVHYMNQILSQYSSSSKDSHLVWTLKAMDESVFLGDIDAAKASYEQAAESVLLQEINASDQQYDLATLKSAQTIRQKAEFLATKPDPTKTQIMAWQSVLSNVVKESERREISDRIKSLKAKLNK